MTRPQEELFQTDLFSLYAAPFRLAAEMMKASLESVQLLQNQQLVALSTALDQHSDAWTGLWHATGETQMAVLAQMQSQMAQVQDALSGAGVASAGVREAAPAAARKAA